VIAGDGNLQLPPSVTPLEAYLGNRHLPDFAPMVEWLYRIAPRPVARLIERRLTPRHMRDLAAKISFQPTPDGGWRMRDGRKTVLTTRPLDKLVGMLDRPVTIVASGPSARDYPWEDVRGGERFIIAVNGAPSFLKEIGVMPDLLVAVDNRFAKTAAAHFTHAPGVPLVTILRSASIMATHSREQLAGRPITILERINSWYGLPQLDHDRLLELNQDSNEPFRFPSVPEKRYRVGWSHFPEFGFFSASTVVFVALQVAVRLGAKEIEIVGMDLSEGGRVYDEGDNPRPSGLVGHYEKSILPSFKLMHEALKGTGVRIRNRSPICPLPDDLFAASI
jgi:Kdo-III transferase WaaZ